MVDLGAAFSALAAGKPPVVALTVSSRAGPIDACGSRRADAPPSVIVLKGV